jgi:signal transduction histidine kinase
MHGEAADSAPLAGARVLVVDDDANLLRLVHDNLALEGMDVRAARDVPAARAVLAEWTPDLIILDVMMPGESGLDLCRDLGAQPATRDVPVLFLSARTATEDKVAGLTLGAVDYLAKPFDPAELLARCQVALRTQRRARTAAQAEMNRFRDEVLGLVGHELRTPLTLVLGYAELLRTRGETLSPARLDDYLHHMTVGSTRLAQIVEDVLYLLAPEPRLEPIDLRQPLDEAILASEPRYEERDVCLDFQRPAQPIPVRGAGPSLSVACRHLLLNAAEFSPAGGRVRVVLRTVGAHDDAGPEAQLPEAQLSVADEGPGIEPADQERIFERFYQVSRGVNREHKGLGLGLAIVRRVASQHDGRVSLDSAPGEGSCFTLALPLAVSASADSSAPAGAPAIEHNMP